MKRDFTKNKNGKNKYLIEGDIAKIFFRSGGYFICDAEIVHDLVDCHTWHKNNNGYAETCIDYKHVSAHVFIMGKKEGLEIDHINRNRLDNRRCNLRHVTHAVNMQNRDPQKVYPHNDKNNLCGVYPTLNKKGYKAFIHIRENGKRITVYLGSFKTFEEAVKARRDAEFFYWGEQANEA